MLFWVNMLIEKIFTKNSSLYEKFKPVFINIGKNFDALGLIHLFSVWTIIVSGIVVNLHSNDRYTYWDWSNWIEGSLKLLLISLLFLQYLFPRKLWLLGNKILNLKEILYHSILGFMIMLVGYLNFDSSFADAFLLFPYYLALLSCILIFQFTLILDTDSGTWSVLNWKNKQSNLTISLLIMLSAVGLGILFDDPIISTAGMVSSPYALIAVVWPNHVRHLQRARFYPLFTFAMFLCVRAPWFIIPLLLLFFILRITNYFRYGIAYPSFAVDFLDEEL